MNPHVDEVCIEDISQALSMNCRYSGHVSKFYSVAEHSVLIARLVLKETGDVHEALGALLHDASEAYLTDIPRPIKPKLTNYFELEAIAEKVIQDKFRIQPMSDYVKYLDTHICGTEAVQLFLEIPEWTNDYDDIPIIVQSWTPKKAKKEFLNMFNKLQKEINDNN